jgi:hypothetical protein
MESLKYTAKTIAYCNMYVNKIFIIRQIYNNHRKN